MSKDNEIREKLTRLDNILEVMLDIAAVEIVEWNHTGLLKKDGVIRKLAAEFVDLPVSGVGFVKDRVTIKCVERIANAAKAVQTTNSNSQD